MSSSSSSMLEFNLQHRDVMATRGMFSFHKLPNFSLSSKGLYHAQKYEVRKMDFIHVWQIPSDEEKTNASYLFN